MGIGDVGAERAARDVVANDLRVRPLRVSQEDPHYLVTARNVGEDLRPGRVEDGEAVDRVAYGIIPRDSGIVLSINVDPEDIVSDNIVHDLGARTAPTTDAFGSVSGLPITWLFAIVVLTLMATTIPPATLPMIRFPTTVALRAPKTSITYACPPPLPCNLEAPDREAGNAHIAHALPLISPVSMFTSPKTQIASGPPKASSRASLPWRWRALRSRRRLLRAA